MAGKKLVKKREKGMKRRTFLVFKTKVYIVRLITNPSLLLINEPKKLRVASRKAKVQQRINSKNITNVSCGSSKWTSSEKKEI